MKSFRIMSAVSLVLLLVPKGLAVVDQQYVPATTNTIAIAGASNQADCAQTFTVGITGKLTGFDLWINRQQEVIQPLLVDIRKTQPGRAVIPTADDSGPNVLASVVLPADFFLAAELGAGPPPTTLRHIDLDAKSFPVVAGDVLAIVVRSNDSGGTTGLSYHWHGQDPGAYTRGSAYLRGTSGWHEIPDDLVFRTYVTPIPEPSGIVLAAFAIAILAWRRV